MFALDTDTLIYYFKGIGSVAQHLLATPPNEIAIPAVVLYELEVGLAKSSQPAQRRKALEALLEIVRILPFDKAAAQASADIRAHLERSGISIGPLDTLIAGIAKANGATLVTHNTQEFSRIPHLPVVDWH
jgi:tRNA(fMet)-specific endonuclease VapC